MKKHVTVKQTHLETKQKNILFQGLLDIKQAEKTAVIEYTEKDQQAAVRLYVEPQGFHIRRSGEMLTELHFQEHELTRGTIQSAYGTIEVEIYTHKYIQKDNIIAVEYDVMVDGLVTDSFRFLCTLKEVTA